MVPEALNVGKCMLVFKVKINVEILVLSKLKSLGFQHIFWTLIKILNPPSLEIGIRVLFSKGAISLP